MNLRKLLIFDLDETLVHARKAQLSIEHDFEVAPYFVYIRPHLDQLLSYCSTAFDLAVWSSSSEQYVRDVTDRIFGSQYPLVFSWSVARCVQKEDLVSGGYLYIKDLRKVRSQGYDVESIIMVDDSPEKIKRQPNHLVAVPPFEGSETDNELLLLIDKLRSRRGVTCGKR